MGAGKQKADPDFIDRLLGRLGWQIDPHPQSFQNVGRAALAGSFAVAVFGHRYPSAGSDKSRRSRDIEAAGPVAAGAASVDQGPAQGVNLERGGPHGASKTGDLEGSFPPHRQGRQKRSHPHRRKLPLHDLIHQLLGLA